jgi:hypothetical protein
MPFGTSTSTALSNSTRSGGSGVKEALGSEPLVPQKAKSTTETAAA